MKILLYLVLLFFNSQFKDSFHNFFLFILFSNKLSHSFLVNYYKVLQHFFRNC